MSRVELLLENGLLDHDDIVEFSGGFLNSIINKLGKKGLELHYISPFSGKRHNFSGPGTQLQNRLENYFDIIENPNIKPIAKKGSKPVNDADKASMNHDVCYEANKTLKDRKKCDDAMIKQLKKSRKNKKDKFANRADASVLEALMRTKRFLGLGFQTDDGDIMYV